MSDRKSYIDDANEVKELDDLWFEEAKLVRGPGTMVHIKLDADVVAYFKAQGPDWIHRIQDVLKAHVEADKAKR